MTDSQRVTWTLDCCGNSCNVLLSKAINLVKVFNAWRVRSAFGDVLYSEKIRFVMYFVVHVDMLKKVKN